MGKHGESPLKDHLKSSREQQNGKAWGITSEGSPKAIDISSAKRDDMELNRLSEL